MGNKISNSTDTIGFQNTNINNYSSTLPGNFKITKEINQVIDNIPLSNLDSLKNNQQTGGNDNLSEESLGINDIFKKLEKNEVNNNEISDTSPFISSDMYNFLMKGGAKKSSKKSSKNTSKKSSKNTSKKSSKKTSKGASQNMMIDDETSLTIDSSDSPDKKNKVKESLDDEDDEKDEDIEYESSSAHTNINDNNSDDSDENNASAVLLKQNTKGKKFKEISSVNTSDIKLITE